MIRLDGKTVASTRHALLKERIAGFVKAQGRKPCLAVVIVGEDPASRVYVKNKVKTTIELGMESVHLELSGHATQDEVLQTVRKLNGDDNVDGILVQLPLPAHLDANAIVEAISPEKDPDGLTTANLGLLFAGRKRVAPCTPWGVMSILAHHNIAVAGKRVVVIGRSNIVGKPMAQLLTDANATVTLCHAKTQDLYHHTRDAEIVVVAAGKPRFIGKDAFAKDAVVVDVGIHRPQTGDFAGKLCGDVRYDELDGHVAAATPVPGGVGPMTIQMLMENTVTLAEKRLTL